MTNEIKNDFFIKVANFEGFRSRPYRCPAGYLTIGYGHTDGVRTTSRVDLETARKLLRQDFDKILTMLCSEPYILQEHELYAIADLVFNIGFTAFKRTSLRNLLIAYHTAIEKNNKQYQDVLRFKIADKLLEFCHYHDKDGNVQKSLGLLRRREFERRLFLEGHVY